MLMHAPRRETKGNSSHGGMHVTMQLRQPAAGIFAVVRPTVTV